ncbi:MAG: hypothetical protein RLN85_10605, partial [Pseudomonadales bacterium]
MAPDDIQPLLHVTLVLELGFCTGASGRKELVQIELIKLTSARDCQEFIGHLIGQQPHLGQRAIRIPLTRML